MTVSSTSSRVVYNGNGSTTVFPFAFKVQSSADLVVVFTDATGTDSTLSPSVYSATGFGQDAGGSVTYPLSGSPIATGTRLTIYRQVSPTQPTSISNQGAMWPAVIEAALDRLTFIVQYFLDGLSRALVISPTDGGTLNPLPNATNRANMLLGFDSSGQPVTVTSIGSTGVAAWLANNFLLAGTSASAACSALQAFFLGGNNAPSGNMTPSAGTWDLTAAAVKVATATAGTNTTAGASTAFVQAAIAARTAVNDANVAPADTSRVIAYTALSTARSVNLPAASTITAGRRIVVADESGSASAAITISLVPNGTDTIAGSNTTQVGINVAYGSCVIVCNGASGWIVEKWSVKYTNTISGDVTLGDTNFHDGPSVAQGAVGTWRASGNIVGNDSTGTVEVISAKLWDGTTVIDSGAVSTQGSNQFGHIALSGIISGPAANIRISAKSAGGAGLIKQGASGAGKDSTITVERIA
jgi:hypothetical protein